MAARAESQESVASLHELTAATAAVGVWTVSVYSPALVEVYDFQYQGQKKQGKKVSVLFLSSDAETYCLGKAKKSAAFGDQALAAVAAKFKAGTMWKITKVALFSENSSHVSCPVKVAVDLCKTTFTQLLQSTVQMPKQPAPPEQLSDLLKVSKMQKCDVTVLIQSISEVPRNVKTPQGQRLIDEVTITDGSEVGGKPAKASLPFFFKESDAGRVSLANLRESFKDKQPVSLFGIYCTPPQGSIDQEVVVKTASDFWWEPSTTGSKAKRLAEEAEQLLAIGADSFKQIAVSDKFVPHEKIDYKAGSATVVVCAILDAFMCHEGAALKETGAVALDSLLQLNCVRIVEPSTSEDVQTKDKARLFVPVRILDHTGTVVNLRMREEAALEASGCPSMNEFVERLQRGELVFPLLASVRVRIKVQSTEGSDSGAFRGVEAVIVEATEQDVTEGCRPNSSGLELAAACKLLPRSSETVLVGMLSDICRAPHSGITVGKVSCEFAISLIATTGKSQLLEFGAGYRIVTGDLQECCYKALASQGSAVLTAKSIPGQLVSMCTLDNLMQFKLTPSRVGGVTYAVVLISGVILPVTGSALEPSSCTYVADRVHILSADYRTAYAALLRELAKVVTLFRSNGQVKRSDDWVATTTASLASAKKVRRLSKEPTNAPLPDTDADE